MTVEILDTQVYMERLMAAPRPGAEKVLAFYDHRVGAFCRDARLMLMPWDDHLVHRGDGVFETLKYERRKIYQLGAHIERMKRSSAAIFLAPPCDWERVSELVVECARAGGRDVGLLRVLLGRGPGGFGIDTAECPASSLYIVAYAYAPKPAAYFERGVTAFRTSIPAKQNYLARIKSIDYLPNALMKMEAVERGEDFPVCFDDKGCLAEGATENIAIVDGAGRLVVPELTHALAGTTLMRALELSAGEIESVFVPVSEKDLAAAREMLVLGTTPDALSIVRYDGRPVGDGRPGPVSRRLKELLERDMEENGTIF